MTTKFFFILEFSIVTSKLWLFNRERLFVDISKKLQKSKSVNRYELCPPFYYFTGRDIHRGSKKQLSSNSGKVSSLASTVRIFIECRRNKCTCLNGEPAIQCHSHGNEECKNCQENYHRFGNSCQLNKGEI